MTAKIFSKDRLEDTRRRRVQDDTCKGAGAELPPVTGSLIDTLFEIEKDQRRDPFGLPHAA